MIRRYFLLGFFALSLCVGFGAQTFAQELVPDTQTTVKAKVLSIERSETEILPGLGIRSDYQILLAEILEGREKGKVITLENNFIKLKEGEVIYVLHTQSHFDGAEYYSVSEPYRLPWVALFVGLFVILIVVFGGLQGLRGLIALVGSFLCIFYLLIPGILHGYSPVLMSMGVASVIVVLGSYITHGFNRTTTSAVFGMIATIGVTGFLAMLAVSSSRLTGLTSEEAIYLNFNTGGGVDFVGLLLGGMLIGLLGVLYDAAIAQAIAVEELYSIGGNVSKTVVYKKALRIGREHIGALVNTLALAYVGVALPLLLFFVHSSSAGIGEVLNREIFASEIIRTVIGSMGLVLAIPITTFFAVKMLAPKEGSKGEQKKESNSPHTHKHTA